MQFIDLKSQYRQIERDLTTRINKVLEHGVYVMGPENAELEEQLKALAGTRYALGCSSGTDALLMALMAWGIGPGDAVFTPVFTFFATAEAVALTGATPVFVDILPDTFNMDPEALEKAAKQIAGEGKLRMKAVIPVDLFGLPANYTAIRKIAKKYGLLILEDAAQSFGALQGGRPAGSLGDIAATSFFPAKPLGCYGDGGALFTDNAEWAEALSSVRAHGQGRDKYENNRLGINGRLDTLQAAVLLSKLTVFEEEIASRNEIAAKYSEALEGTVQTPASCEGCVSAWAQYSVLAKDGEERAHIMEHLEGEGIPTAIYYKKPLHLQKAFETLGYKEGDFPVAEEISSRIFSLPMHPYLTDGDIGRIAQAVRAAVQGEERYDGR